MSEPIAERAENAGAARASSAESAGGEPGVEARPREPGAPAEPAAAEERPGPVARVTGYVEKHLWSRERLPIPLGWLRGLVQLGVVIGEGFVKDQLLMRAHSLTYLTLLSIVPLLGLVATFGDIIGAREQVIAMISEQLAEAVPQAADYLVGFVQDLDFRQLGAGAAAVLVLTTVLAVGNAEKAFNAVWGVQQQRPWVRRIADYLAILVIAPLLLGPALALRGAFESQTAVQHILEVVPGAQTAFDAGIQQLPTLMMVLAFSFLYWFLPNTVVRFLAAVGGGVVAGVLFTLLQKLFVVVTGGAAQRFGAMFGTFATVPIFMLWVYYSWGITLLGAEVAYAIQTLPRYRREVRGAPAGPASREALGLAIALEVARSFRRAQPAPTTEALSERLDVPLRVVREVMAELEASRIVSAVHGPPGEDPGFQLARPADAILVLDVLMALRGPRDVTVGLPEIERAVRGFFSDLEVSVSNALSSRTLEEMADALTAAAPEGSPA